MIYMWLINTDTKSYKLRLTEKFLATVQQENKFKYLDS